MKLIILQGPPSTGKSTWAKKTQAANPDTTVIVNRDSIRFGRGLYNVPNQEGYITEIEDFSIRAGLKNDYTVIVDATNLNPKTVARLRSIASEFGIEPEFKDFYIPMSEAIENDVKRGLEGGLSVGKKVIERFYKMYYPDKIDSEIPSQKGYTDPRLITLPNTELPPCVICDLDGTLAIHHGRNAFDYARLSTDYADPRLVRILRQYLEDCIHVIFLSGREQIDNVYNDTLEWIRKSIGDEYLYTKKMDGVHPNFDLIMRENGDHRADNIVKKEIYERKIKGIYDVMCIFDDRDKVVKMWRDEGLLCCQVYYGNF
jgi:predicted kinase